MALSRKNKILFVFFPVLVIVVATVVLVVVLTRKSPGASEQATDQPTAASSLHRFSMRDWFMGVYYARDSSARWISDSEFLTTIAGNITVTSLLSNESTVLVPSHVLLNMSARWQSFSADREWALLRTNYVKRYRHSYLADYYGYHIATGDLVKIESPDPSNQIQLVVWGNTGNKLAFVQNNNIFYKNCTNCTTYVITANGETNKIYNGIPDWVYEEDVYGSNRALWFSPDDSYLGYAEFNDTQVTWFSYMYYGPNRNAYTEVKKIAYPKPGFANPTVKVRLVNLQTLPADPKQLPNATDFDPPNDLRDVEHYFNSMEWVDRNELSLAWTNRVQNVSIVVICNATSATCHENQIQEVSNGWVSTSTYRQGSQFFSKDGSYYLTLFPFEQGEQGKFLHLGKITVPSNRRGQITNLTYGTWEVAGILSFDKKNEIAYFASTETSPREMHIYSFNLKTSAITCLSCSLPWSKSGRCKYFIASFSTSASWYTLRCYGPGVPITSRHSTKNNEFTILEGNNALIERLKGLAAPIRRNFQFTSGDYEIEAQEILPPDFDETKKYGVLFSVYGGPASQKVIEAFTYRWEEYLVSNFDIIVVKLDARGTRRRGERFKHAVYLKLGEYEAEDTINAGRYMRGKSYVDKNKLAIWGWSYGGYLTTYVLSKNTGVFKVGIAVAPVTDWHYYDSAYTERYMRLPHDNPEGYKYTSLLSRAKQFANVSYLIVHGSGDDNVHYQHTAQMVKALTNAGVEFRVQYYTDKTHSIYGVSGHLYTLLTKFLTTKLGIVTPK